MTNKLIVYYSRADENYVNGEIKTIEVGNTQKVAEIIQKLTNADLFQIEQVNPYSRDYNECIAQAQEDQRKDVRPELKEYPDSLKEYDVIYLGYPNYWSTMPMAVFTFLERYDLKGKEIRPFCTHEGSGLGSSMDDLKKLCPDSNITQGLAIRGANVDQSQKEIEQWIKKERK